MTTKTLPQTIQIVIYREGNIYLFGRWRNGKKEHEQVIPSGEAQRIIQKHPNGSTPTGNRADFAHTPCYWQWSVTIEEKPA